MTATTPAATGNRVLSVLHGCQAARRALMTVRSGIGHPDALHEALQAELAHGDADRLRGFTRELQKRLEVADDPRQT